MTTKIQIKDYLAKWLLLKYNNGVDGAVKFNENQDIYHIILALTTLKKGFCAKTDENTNIEIVLPCPRIGKRPEFYNYLSPRAVDIIERKLKIEFYIDARDFLREKNSKGINIKTAAFMFIAKYHLDGMISEDAIIKNFYRHRKNYILKRKNFTHDF